MKKVKECCVLCRVDTWIEWKPGYDGWCKNRKCECHTTSATPVAEVAENTPNSKECCDTPCKHCPYRINDCPTCHTPPPPEKHANCNHSEDFDSTCEGLEKMLDEDPPESGSAEGWEQRFDKEFIEDNLWEEGNGETKFTGVGNIKAFIAREIATARDAGIRAALEALPSEKIHKEFECGTKYECWCEDQSCPRFTEKYWNSYRTAARTALEWLLTPEDTQI